MLLNFLELTLFKTNISQSNVLSILHNFSNHVDWLIAKVYAYRMKNSSAGLLGKESR